MHNTEIKIVYSNLEYAKSYNKALTRVAQERDFLASIDGFSLEGTISFMQEIIQNNHAQYFAIANNKVIGWCDIIPKSMVGFKHVGTMGMGIVKEYRGQGIGSRLLKEAINHSQNICHLEKIELDVFESNINAIKLYKKLDFIEEGKRIKARKLDNIYTNEIQMGLIL